jgi:signal transduction histidine kinase
MPDCTRTILLSFLLLFYTVRSFGQSEEYASDLEWYEHFFQENNTESVEKKLTYHKLKLQNARLSNDAVAEARALNELGLLHLTKTHNLDSASDFLFKALTIEETNNLNTQRIFTSLAIARIFEEVIDHEKCKAYLEDAFRVNEVAGNVNIKAYILIKIGNLYSSMGAARSEEALDTYQMVLKDVDKLNQPHVEAEVLLNIANLYKSGGQYKEAIEEHKRSLAISRSINDKKMEALSLNEIGSIYWLMKNNEKALANYVIALDIRKSLKDKKAIAQSYNNIGILYYNQKNLERAIANLNLALQAVNDAEAPQEVSRTCEYLSQCYKERGDFKRSLELKEHQLGIVDLIERERDEQRLLGQEIDQREKQIVNLEADRKQRDQKLLEQKRLQNFLFIVIALGVVIVLLTLYLYIVKRRSNKILEVAHAKVQEQNVELQNLNATKDKFFSIISHDLKGPLNSLTSFSGLLINHADSLSKEEIQMLAKDLDKSLKNLFALLENLLEWSRAQTGNIEFKPSVFDLTEVLEENKALLTAQAHNKKISLVNTSLGAVQVQADRNSVNTVVRNLISNAIKFTPPEGKIELGVKLSSDMVIVSIADNGVGMSKEIMSKLFRIDTKHTTKGTADEKGTGLGLILCKEFIEKNGGSISVDSEIGVGSVFRFSLKNVKY